MKIKLLASLLLVAVYSQSIFAQADLGGLTGKYFAADGLEFENMLKAKKKQKDDISMTFVGEADGKIQNMLVLKWKGGELKAFLDEKLYNKKKVVWFKAGDNTFFELAPGVYAIANGDGSKVGDVLAKDKNQLKDFDIETAKALIDEKTSEIKADASSAELQKKMKFDAFKNNLEKVIFVDNRNAIFSAYGEPKEDPKVHIKTQEIGKPVWFNYYSQTNAQTKYGKTAEINIEYEMEGVKKDRKSCAKLGRNWASSLPVVPTRDDYMFLNGRSFCDPSTKIYDYAFLALMSELNGKLLFGTTYNLKVTVYAYKDGANVGKLGEGVIAMKYEPASQKAMDLWKEWIDQL